MNVKCSTLTSIRGWPGLLFLGLLVLASAAAESSAAADFDHGLLWKIETAGGEPSYLFGTMHSEDPRVVQLPSPVRAALETARGVTLEVALDPESLLAMASGFMLDGRRLEAIVGAPLYHRAAAAVATYGIPEAVLATMKPWAVAVILTAPPGDTGAVLDLLLYQQAVAAGKPVDGLETPKEQLGVFDGLSESDQVALLEDTLDSLPEAERMLKEVTDAYLARDLQRLATISEAAMRGSDPGRMERFCRALITERNQRMATRMQPYLRRGGRFIAVGALHLPGADGLLRLLSQQGYHLIRLY